MSMGFSRQESWSGLPCCPPDLSYAGIKPKSLASPSLAVSFFTPSTTWEVHESHSENSLALVVGKPNTGYRGLDNNITLSPRPLTNLEQTTHAFAAATLGFSDIPI